MDDMLMHPIRATLAACGVLLALAGFVSLDAPIPMMLAVPLILRFLVTPARSLQAVGGVFAVITVFSFSVNRVEFELGITRDFLVYGALALMTLPLLHQLVTQGISSIKASQ